MDKAGLYTREGGKGVGKINSIAKLKKYLPLKFECGGDMNVYYFGSDVYRR